MKMKKVLAVIMALAMVFAITACGNKEKPAEEPAEEAEEEAAEEAAEGVMSYADYIAAPLDSEVTVETYVQAKQGFWEDSATIYTQDEDGAYFIYSMPCIQEEYDAMAEGTKIRVTGTKSEWSGEVEIVDVTNFEVIEGSFIAEPVDLTDKLASDELIDYQNQKFAVKGLTVEASEDGDGNAAPFLYGWDGSGQQGDDVYFKASLNGQTYTFTIESYLTGADTDVYKAAEALEAGQTIDIEGFLYWYEGVNPHVTAIK